MSSAGIRAAALWLALGVAVFPLLLDLVAYWQDNAWSRYSLVFVALLILAVRAAPPASSRPAVGAILIGLAACGSVLAAASGTTFARPGVALAIVGLLLLLGQSGVRTALLACWIVPVPWSVSRWLDDGWRISGRLHEGAARVVEPFGVQVDLSAGHTARVGDAEILISHDLAGLPLVAFLTGIAWYLADRDDLSLGRTASLLGAATIAAVPLQLLLIVVVLALAARGLAPATAAAFLQTAVWVSGVSLLFVSTRRLVRHRAAPAR